MICKKILKYNSNSKAAFKSSQNALKEFEVLHNINHQCICKAYFMNLAEKIEDPNIDAKHQKSDMTIISLYLEYLYYSLKECLIKIEMNNTLKTRIVIEIIHAMNYIHKNGMINHDLKIKNTLLNSFFEAKLIDFGFVRIYECLSDDYSSVNNSLIFFLHVARNVK